MLLSNKLTYCITTFIFLVAFVAVPVMAHTPGDGHDAAHDGDNPATADVVETDFAEEVNHTHTAAPMVSAITAVDTKGLPAVGGTLVSNVDGRDIVLVDDLTAADDARLVIALTDHDNDATTGTPPTPEQLAAGAFQLKITFNEDVYPVAQAGTTAGVAPAIAVDTGAFTGVTFLAATKNGVDVSTSFTLGTLTRVQTAGADTTEATDDEFSLREFLVPVTVGAGLTELQLPVSLWVTVGANQVYTLSKIVNGETVQGRGNTEYSTPGSDPFSVDGYVAPTITTPDDTAGPDIVTFTSSAADSDGNVTFTLTFSEALGTSGLIPADLTITGGTLVTDGITPAGSATVYMIKVTPDDDPTEAEVTVRLNDGSVSDKVDGARYVEPMDEADVKIGRYDTVNPTVNAVATGVVGTGTGTDGNGIAVGMVKLSVTFSEELGSDMAGFENDDIDRTNSNVLLTNTDPMLATMPEGNKTVWELTVTPVPANAAQVVIVIKAGSVMDMATNPLLQDTIVTWTRPGADTESDNPVVTIALDAGMTYIDSVSGGTVTVTASDSGSGLATGAEIIETEVTIENGSIMAGSFTKGATATFTLIPNVGAISVKVTVAAGAVADADGNTNVLQTDMTKPNANPMTFKVGPTFTIPANTILVVTKTEGLTHQYLSDQPRLPVTSNPPVPAPDIQTAVWDNMPDLEVLFSLSGGGNGGTINLTEAMGQDELSQTRDGDKQQRNSVRISEVMWASDLSMRGAQDDAEAAEQWIEISNDTGEEVEIFLFARTGRDSAINVDDVEDRVGNAYNGSPGSAPWAVKGQNGNSYTGVDFISMHRSYVTGDNRGYVNGTSSGHWHNSDREYLTLATRNPNDGALYNYIGSPGRPHTFNLTLPNTRERTTMVARVKEKNDDGSDKKDGNGKQIYKSVPTVIINEVANRDNANAEYEWIELKNVSSSNVNLRNWMISMVTEVGTDRPLVQFPNNNNAQIGPGEVLLLLATDPRHDDDHPIAVGLNVDIPHASDQVDGLGLVEGDNSNRKPPRQKVVTFENGGLPDNGNYILILRRHDNHEGHRSGVDGGKGVAETGEADIDKIMDIAGHHEGLSKSNYPASTPEGLNSTTLWPLWNFNGDMRPHRGHGDWNHRRHNRIEANKVRYRQHVSTYAKNDGDGGTPGNRAGTGTNHKDENVGNYAFRDADYTGLGYKRTARIAGYNHGTPGYDGNSVGNTGIVKATAADAMVTISEVMYSTGPDADNPILPQWIELYNSSPTVAVNLRGWKLRFEMLDADGNPMDSLMYLEFNKSRVKTILPQQTVLIVAGNARQANSDSATGGDVFNDNRVFNVFRDYGGANKFGANTRYMFFDQKVFYIGVIDKDGKVVDEVGNLDGDSRTSDTNNWEFPSGIAADDNRTSIIRVYDDADGLGGESGKARTGKNTAESNVMPIFGSGDKKMTDDDGIADKWSWIPAVNTEREFKITIKSTWYGDEDDYGTPGNRPGMVLPVELSHFRPTLEDGEVTIRWTTESELDNAGFNILRSETRDGEYTQINAELIEGAGTTGERNTYKWVDQTAKPGVVYYYQIEDVSFAGERQALAITKLKGLISAENKLTTTWSELKASQ